MIGDDSLSTHNLEDAPVNAVVANFWDVVYFHL